MFFKGTRNKKCVGRFLGFDWFGVWLGFLFLKN